MEIRGKKINFLGDSITQGTGTSSPEKQFVNIIASKYGAVCRNYGIGGTRIAYQKNPDDVLRELDFCKRFSQMDDDADIVAVFGGTNDYGHGDAPMGEFGDKNPDTFYGACDTLFSGLLNKYPNSIIFIMTPMHRGNERNPVTRDGKEYILEDYVKAIRKVAEYYSLPVLDLFKESGIQPEITVIREKYMPDALHPNNEGNEVLVNKIVKFIENL